MLRSLERFALRARRAAGLRGELAVLLAPSAEIQQLNRDFRGKNKPTDVLSFPSEAPGLAGDIAISLEIAEENGTHFGHGTLTELQILMLHGMLHLAGYDHEADKGEMAELEASLRAKLGLEHGLIERANSTARKTSSPKKRSANSNASTRVKRTGKISGMTSGKKAVRKRTAPVSADKRKRS